MAETMNDERGTMNAMRASCARPHHSMCRSSAGGHLSAFSLVELLVVIGLVVLIIAMALPAFNFITGSRSVDAGINVLGAFIGRARAEALDRGKITGVMFYIDPASQRRGMLLVTETSTKYATSGASLDNPNIDVYLDLMEEREPILLPRGIDLQFMDNGSKGSGGQLQDPYFDRYLGFNTVLAQANNPSNVLVNSRQPLGGVILFDGTGKLVSLRYAFRCSTGTNNPSSPITRFAQFVDPTLDPNTATASDGVIRPSAGNDPARLLRSQVGIAIFEQDLFAAAGYTLQDYECNTAQVTVAAESQEEAWLDENAIPLLVNRYNGTLVRGQ